MAQGNSIKVGAFRNNGGVISGWIRTFQLNVDYAELIPVTARTDASPSYEIWGENKAGKMAYLGALWPRKTKRDSTPFHGGFIDDRGEQGELNVAVFGDFETGADMTSKKDDDSYVPARAQSGDGREQRPSFGGFAGGSTAGSGGGYVGPNGGEPHAFGGYSGGMTTGGGDAGSPLDDDVPF